MIKPTLPSTASLNQSALSSLRQLQAQFVKSQQELTTGRIADPSQSLGYKLGDSVSLRHDQARLKAIMDANGFVKSRLDTSQAVLKNISENAQQFLNTLIGASNADVGPSVLKSAATTGLSDFNEAINTSFNGTQLFSGINTDVKPMENYFGSTMPASRQAVVAAFTSTFGFPPDDPAAANISASSMQGFLDTTFSNLFADPAWAANWSGASDQNIRSRIGTSELIETSTNFNDPAFRKLVSAFTMVADLGTANLGDGARQAIVNSARKLVGDSIGELNQLQASLGDAQSRVKSANERMDLQIDIMTVHLNGLEAVDPAEASTKLSELMTQIQTAYTLTARIHQLSLLNEI